MVLFIERFFIETFQKESKLIKGFKCKLIAYLISKYNQLNRKKEKKEKIIKFNYWYFFIPNLHFLHLHKFNLIIRFFP